MIAFDTSGETVIVVAKGETLSRRRGRLHRATAEVLVEWLDAVSRRVGLSEKKNVVLGVGLGPGSLTSVRVGLAAAKALAWAKQWPLVGFNSLDLLAVSMPTCEEKHLWVLRDARRNNVFARRYEKFNKRTWKPVRPCALMTLNEWIKILRRDLRRTHESVLVALDPHHFLGVVKPTDIKDERVRLIRAPLPKPSALLQLTRQLWRDQGPVDPETILPVYLYSDDCQVQPKP